MTDYPYKQAAIPKLKPCNWCSFMPELTEWFDQDQTVQACHVQCQCGASTPDMFGVVAKDNAVKFWNEHIGRRP